MTTKYVYLFHEGDKDQKDLLGGKGANLAEMTNLGPARASRLHDHHRSLQRLHAGRHAAPRRPDGPGEARRSRPSKRRPARSFGDPTNPLLVSVRSGAKFSMPGMMDTVLNLGLNATTLHGLIAGYRRRALRLRRLSPLHHDVLRHRAGAGAQEVRPHLQRGEEVRRCHRGLAPDARRAEGRRRSLQGAREVRDRQRLPGRPDAAARAGDPRRLQLVEQRARVPATARSSTSRTTSAPRSTSRRWSSATWAPTPAPASPSRATPRRASSKISGEYLMNAQGEDVVAGIRTPSDDRATRAATIPRSTSSSPTSARRSRSTTTR